MSKKKRWQHHDLVNENKIFGWIAIAAIAVLLVPLAAMQLTDAVKWTVSDFLIAGLLLFGAGGAYVLIARKVHKRYWLMLTLAFVAAFLYVWAELSVGIFTNIGK